MAMRQLYIMKLCDTSNVIFLLLLYIKDISLPISLYHILVYDIISLRLCVNIFIIKICVYHFCSAFE